MGPLGKGLLRSGTCELRWQGTGLVRGTARWRKRRGLQALPVLLNGVLGGCRHCAATLPVSD